MRYFVYIISSKLTKKSYTGITCDLNRRIQEHNQSGGSVNWTKSITDFEFIFCSEFENRITARLVEQYLKSGTGRAFKQSLINSMDL